METTGQPMKIHISMETKLLLDTLGRFFTEHRGLVDRVVAHGLVVVGALGAAAEELAQRVAQVLGEADVLHGLAGVQHGHDKGGLTCHQGKPAVAGIRFQSYKLGS